MGDDREARYENARRDLEKIGFTVDSTGHFVDHDRPERTGGYIDPRTGEVHRDM